MTTNKDMNSLVAYCNLAWIFPINWLLVGNTLIALLSENSEYLYSLLLKTQRISNSCG